MNWSVDALFTGDRVTVLDGGLATELERRGHDLSDPLWSARLLVESPAEIVEAHLAYFRAGARVAVTASYQASFEGFATRGIGSAAAIDFLMPSPPVTIWLKRAIATSASEPPPASRPSRCSSPHRSGRTARCWPMGPSSAVTTA